MRLLTLCTLLLSVSWADLGCAATSTSGSLLMSTGPLTAPVADLSPTTDSTPLEARAHYAILELPRGDGDLLNVRSSSAQSGLHGGSTVYEDPHYDFFPTLWDEFGDPRQLYLPPGMSGIDVWAVNDFGEAASRTPLRQGMYWDRSGEHHFLPDLGNGGVEIDAMNNLGVVVGSAKLIGTTASHAYVWSLGTGMIDLGDLNPEEDVTSVAYDINDDGVIVGYSRREVGSSGQYPVAWINDHIQLLPALPIKGASDRAVGINDFGIIVGACIQPDREGQGVAVWPSAADDPIILRDPYPKTAIRPVAINNNNIIIGDGETNRSTALIWYDWDKQPVKLTDLLPWGSRWTLRASYSLNDHNQIGGLAFHNGRDTGFVATPVYPSIVMSEASPGIAGERNTFQIANLRPNERVHLVAGKYGGGALIPGCSMLQNVLQIDHPKIVTTTTADALGNATIEGFVPAYLSGQTRVLQAVTPGTCGISNLVVQTFN